MSRAQLQLSPFFHNILPLLFTPEPFYFNEGLLEQQQQNYKNLNNLRKASLAKVASKLFKPANFKLAPGHIVTDSTSKGEKLKINGSRALSPSSLKLFKILKIQHNGMSALCKDIKSGRTSTQSINNLRTLDLNDLLTLHINPNFAFSKDLLDMSRMKNLHGKSPNSDNILTQDDSARTTRSGLVYNSSKIRPNKGIIKNRQYMNDVDNFYCNGPSQREAIIRGLSMARQAGMKLSNQQLKLFHGISTPFSQSRFTVKNILKKGSSKPKLQFNETVQLKTGGSISSVQLQHEKEELLQCNFSRVALQPFGILSLKETALLY